MRLAVFALLALALAFAAGWLAGYRRGLLDFAPLPSSEPDSAFWTARSPTAVVGALALGLLALTLWLNALP